MEAIPSNLTENCKIISKTTRQQALIKQFQKPTFDCFAPDWGSKKQYLMIFQNAAKKVVLRNRINKYLSILRSLKSCSSSKTCINYYIEKTADVKELKFGRSCKFPILNSGWKEKCLESFEFTDREELNSKDLPNHLHPRLPFVYKRMEYYPSNLMDISSCHDNYLRINKYNKSDEELCSPNEPRNEFYGSLKSNCGVERMISSPNISNESLLKSESFSQVTASLRPLEDMTNSFKQWRHLPHVFNRNHCSKNLSFPRRMNYADLFLSGLPLPTDKFNVRHCV